MRVFSRCMPFVEASPPEGMRALTDARFFGLHAVYGSVSAEGDESTDGHAFFHCVPLREVALPDKPTFIAKMPSRIARNPLFASSGAIPALAGAPWIAASTMRINAGRKRRRALHKPPRREHLPCGAQRLEIRAGRVACGKSGRGCRERRPFARQFRRALLRNGDAPPGTFPVRGASSVLPPFAPCQIAGIAPPPIFRLRRFHCARQDSCGGVSAFRSWLFRAPLTESRRGRRFRRRRPLPRPVRRSHCRRRRRSGRRREFSSPAPRTLRGVP